MGPHTPGRRAADDLPGVPSPASSEARAGVVDLVATAVLRLAGAGLLAAMAGIHLYLWDTGYRSIDTIGPLFLLNGVLGVLGALAVVATPRRWLGWVAAGGAALQAGTLGGLVLSLTVGLFGFTESTRAELVIETIWVESAGTVVLGLAVARELFAKPPG